MTTLVKQLGPIIVQSKPTHSGNKDESEGYVLEDFPRTSSHLELLKREVDEFLRTKSLQVFNSLLLKKPTISSETSEMPTNRRVSSAAESVHQARQSVNSMKGSSHLASAGVLPGECAKKQLHDFFTSVMHLDVPYKSLVTNIHNLKSQCPLQLSTPFNTSLFFSYLILPYLIRFS